MANNLLKFCAAALAGSLIGVAYEKWPNIKSDLFTGVSADSSLVPNQPAQVPFEDLFNRASHKLVNVDSKVSAENLLRSSRLRSPIWVLEHLHQGKFESKNRNVTRNRSKFMEDSSIHEYFRATLKDFKHSHLDRGHMAAAANHKMTQDDLDQTFVLSNISPQEGSFNSGGWERLENYVRWLAKMSKNLYVVTGPLYLPQKARDGKTYVIYRVIGDNMVSVPTHYFKVILTEWEDGRLALEAFMMANDPSINSGINLDDYRVPISELDRIERAAGMIFFNALQRDKVDAPSSLPSSFKQRHHDNSKTRSPPTADIN